MIADFFNVPVNVTSYQAHATCSLQAKYRCFWEVAFALATSEKKVGEARHKLLQNGDSSGTMHWIYPWLIWHAWFYIILLIIQWMIEQGQNASMKISGSEKKFK